MARQGPEPHIWDIGSKTLVFFDLETTAGLASCSIDVNTGAYDTSPCELLAIAAWSEERAWFEKYSMPARPIEPGASAVNGFRKNGDQLLLHGELVDSVPEATAVLDFIHYLESHQKGVILVAHNCLKFDLNVIIHAAKRAGLHERLARTVDAGLCTFEMCRYAFKPPRSPRPVNLRLGTLVTFLLGRSFEFEAHNARGDVEALKAIFPKLAEWCVTAKCTETIEHYVKRTQIFEWRL